MRWVNFRKKYIRNDRKSTIKLAFVVDFCYNRKNICTNGFGGTYGV